MTVADLLGASRDAHLEYRSAHDRKPQDRAAMREAIQRASELRAQAAQLDPQRTDPTWADFEKTHPHEALTTFYAEQLAR
jgi:hypothetical protein